jgi:uncharacterized tellurite resistance protein B-like protein
MVKHTGEELAKVLKEWYNLEDQTIKLSEDLMKKSDNSFVKVIMEMIKRDSEKHKIMQQFAINHLTKEAFHLTPQELIPLGEVLDKHVQAEAKSMGLANNAITMSRDYFTNFIVSYLMADEIKHHEMLTTLDHVKGQVHPAGVLRGETETGRLP